MEELCRAYYAPVRRFVEWRRGRQDAEDITQAFFLHILEQGIVRHADRLRGRFRTFLLTVLSRFLIHHDRALSAEKRGGKIDFLPLSEAEADSCASPEDMTRFDREWAVAVMDAAAERVGDEIQRDRGPEAIDVLRRFLGIGQEPQTYETAATLLGISHSAVKTEIMRWRRRRF